MYNNRTKTEKEEKGVKNMNKVKYFINSYHTRIKAGLVAFSLIMTTGCTALVGPKNNDDDKDHNHTQKPGTTEVGGFDHDHDHEENPVIQEPVKNIEIEIKPGVVIEVDGSLFPNVENLNNDEIKAILDDLEREQKEQGKAPIVDPSINKPETEKPKNPVKPNKPSETDETEKEHKHEFGDWFAYSDELEERVCSCGEIETRDHSYELTKTSYATYSNGTHYVVDTMTCGTCGHNFVKAHKDVCNLEFSGYDDDYEYHTCHECGFVDKVEHNLKETSNDGKIATYTCENEGCNYTTTVDLTKNPEKPNEDNEQTPEKHQHEYSDWVSLNDDLEVRYCLSCGRADTRSHDYGITSTTYINMGESGHKRETVQTCKNCKHEKTTTSKILGHNIVEKDNGDGTITYTCSQSGCDYTKTIQKVDHTTHNWVETSRSIGAPATEDIHYVNVTYTCTIGGEKRTESQKENCTLSEGTTSTKFDSQYHWKESIGTCECGNHINKITDKIAHNITSTVSYENKGDAGHNVITTKKCDCGYISKTSVLEGHNLDNGTTNTDGSVTYKCTSLGCGYTKTVTKEHTEHDWKETGRSIKDPASTETHYVEVSYKCSCGETKTETITESCTMTPGVSTTNYDDNYHWTETKVSCKCGNSKIEVSNKVAHTMGEWKQINDTEEQRSCTGCGHTEKRNIQHSHTWVETGRKVGSPAGDSSHSITISYTCSCGETKTETKTESCTMTSTGNSITKYDASGHWTESQVKCECGNTKNVKSAVTPHDTSNTVTGNPVPYNDTQHRIPTVVKCSCGYSSTPTYTYENHSWKEEDKGTYIQYTCACGAHKEVQKEEHGEHTYRANSVDNGNGTHTTTYTCTNTKGTCNARTYTETVPHSYTSVQDGDVIIYTCNCGASYTEFVDEPVEPPKPVHNHNYRASSSNNGDGTHTTTYTCTSTVGECDNRTYSETVPHSYTSVQDGDVIIYTCNCGASYTEFADDFVEPENKIIASVTSTPSATKVQSTFAGVKSVEEILASAKSVDDILKDIPEVEDILAGTATVDDLIAAQQTDDKDKQTDQGEAYTFKPL